jgi:hypothetical protein
MSPETATLPIALFTHWLNCGERGISSEAIVSHLTGVPVGHSHWRGDDHPVDPDDFRRCQLLLAAVPLTRLTFGAMRTRSPQWARLVDAWAEIEESAESEVPEYLSGRKGSAPRTYSLMKRVIAGGSFCAACDGTGAAEACPKCKGTGHRTGGRCRNSGCHRGYFYCRTCRGRGYTGGAS